MRERNRGKAVTYARFYQPSGNWDAYTKMLDTWHNNHHLLRPLLATQLDASIWLYNKTAKLTEKIYKDVIEFVRNVEKRTPGAYNFILFVYWSHVLLNASGEKKKQNDAISLLSIWGVYLGIFYHMALETSKPKSNDMYRNVGAWEDLHISVRSDKNSTMPKFWKGFPFTYPCFFVHSLMWMYAFTYVWQAIFFFSNCLVETSDLLTRANSLPVYMPSCTLTEVVGGHVCFRVAVQLYMWPISRRLQRWSETGL